MNQHLPRTMDYLTMFLARHQEARSNSFFDESDLTEDCGLSIVL